MPPPNPSGVPGMGLKVAFTACLLALSKPPTQHPAPFEDGTKSMSMTTGVGLVAGTIGLSTISPSLMRFTYDLFERRKRGSQIRSHTQTQTQAYHEREEGSVRPGIYHPVPSMLPRSKPKPKPQPNRTSPSGRPSRTRNTTTRSGTNEKFAKYIGVVCVSAASVAGAAAVLRRGGPQKPGAYRKESKESLSDEEEGNDNGDGGGDEDNDEDNEDGDKEHAENTNTDNARPDVSTEEQTKPDDPISSPFSHPQEPTNDNTKSLTIHNFDTHTVTIALTTLTLLKRFSTPQRYIRPPRPRRKRSASVKVEASPISNDINHKAKTISDVITPSPSPVDDIIKNLSTCGYHTIVNTTYGELRFGASQENVVQNLDRTFGLSVPPNLTLRERMKSCIVDVVFMLLMSLGMAVYAVLLEWLEINDYRIPRAMIILKNLDPYLALERPLDKPLPLQKIPSHAHSSNAHITHHSPALPSSPYTLPVSGRILIPETEGKHKRTKSLPGKVECERGMDERVKPRFLKERERERRKGQGKNGQTVQVQKGLGLIGIGERTYQMELRRFYDGKK